TRRSLFLLKATIEGVVRLPSAFAMTVGSPPSSTATTEFVVPKSIPTILPIIFPFEFLFEFHFFYYNIIIVLMCMRIIRLVSKECKQRNVSFRLVINIYVSRYKLRSIEAILSFYLQLNVHYFYQSLYMEQLVCCR